MTIIIQISPEKLMVGLGVLILTVGGYFYYYILQTGPSSKPSRKVIRSDPQGCREIIQAKTIPVQSPKSREPPMKNPGHHGDARARPNRRLIHAFGVNNCFTNGDKRLCSEFKKNARTLVSLDDEQWMRLASSVREISVEHFSQTSTPSLFDTIQLITMKAALDPLLHVRISDSSHLDGEASQLAKEINQQWLRSKRSSSPETAFAVQHELKHALRAIVPGWDGENDRENPLNLILPGYETLWRVVLRCFVEVVFRSANKTWRRALEDFAENPTNDQLHLVKAEYGDVSACMVVEEALRLYPPTRRIYREFETEDEMMVVDAAADIEACHRDAAIWGEDVLRFEPARWTRGGADVANKQMIFLPFGADPFTCVAKSGTANRLPFGVAMIAVLVGGLSLAAGNAFELKGEQGWEERNVPLRTDREAYAGMFLQRLG